MFDTNYKFTSIGVIIISIFLLVNIRSVYGASECSSYVDAPPGIVCDVSSQTPQCPMSQQCITYDDFSGPRSSCSTLCVTNSDCVAAYGVNAYCWNDNADLIANICLMGVNETIPNLDRFPICQQYAENFPCMKVNSAGGSGALGIAYCKYVCQCPTTPPVPTPAPTTLEPTTLAPPAPTPAPTTMMPTIETTSSTITTATSSSSTSDDLQVSKSSPTKIKHDDDLSGGVIIVIVIAIVVVVGVCCFLLYGATSKRRINQTRYDPLLRTNIMATYPGSFYPMNQQQPPPPPPQGLFVRNAAFNTKSIMI